MPLQGQGVSLIIRNGNQEVVFAASKQIELDTKQLDFPLPRLPPGEYTGAGSAGKPVTNIQFAIDPDPVDMIVIDEIYLCQRIQTPGQCIRNIDFTARGELYLFCRARLVGETAKLSGLVFSVVDATGRALFTKEISIPGEQESLVRIGSLEEWQPGEFVLTVRGAMVAKLVNDNPVHFTIRADECVPDLAIAPPDRYLPSFSAV